MKRFIRVRPRARREIVAATSWYSERSSSAGANFVAEVEECTRRIIENPRAFAVVHGELRRALLKKFPYTLIFKVAPVAEDSEQIVLLACFHTSRNPDEWRQSLN